MVITYVISISLNKTLCKFLNVPTKMKNKKEVVRITLYNRHFLYYEHIFNIRFINIFL